MPLFRGPPSLRISATQDAGDYRKGSVGVVGKSRDDPHVTEKEELLRGKWSAGLGRTKSGDGFSLGFVRKTSAQASPFHSSIQG